MKPTPKIHTAHLKFPLNLWQQIKLMAKMNRRTVTAEVQLAMENKTREHFSKGSK